MSDEKQKQKAEFFRVGARLVRKLPGRVMPDLLGKTGWVLDYDIEALDQRGVPITEEEAKQRAAGADLYGPSVDRGDNADDDKQNVMGVEAPDDDEGEEAGV